MRINSSVLREIINEEIELFQHEQIMLQEQRRIDLLHNQMRQEVLSEDWKKELPHIGLDVLGLIPGIGEAADLTNAALYAKKGEHLMAAL
jgi:5-methylthioribose kinase